MRLITTTDLVSLIRRIDLQNFLHAAINCLEEDFKRWSEFQVVPRVAMFGGDGVMELMPCADPQFYSFKYVNGHPRNPQIHQPSVFALGAFIDLATGIPRFISEMTILTAVRTAAVAALGAKYCAKSDSSTVGIIGTGAQAEFLVLAMMSVMPIRHCRFFDVDSDAMAKFSENMEGYGIKLTSCDAVEQVVESADIVVTATAKVGAGAIIDVDMLHQGQHIHALGGDSPGKTELKSNVLYHVHHIVEYLPQAMKEAELQSLSDVTVQASVDEFWEIVAGTKVGRKNNSEVTLFDAVGIALEDFSILRLINSLIEQEGIGSEVDLIPALDDPKNLFSILR